MTEIKLTFAELKKRLENELSELKKELADIAIEDKTAPGGYLAKETNTQEGVLDDADQASEMTNIHNNDAIMDILVERKEAVEQALNRMEKGEYGKCHQCGKEIENKRLVVNAAATACIEHMEI